MCATQKKPQPQKKVHVVSLSFQSGSITFLVFVNDLHHVTKFLDPIIFEDDTKLFYSNSN